MPTANQFEVEVKTLLGSREAAEEFVVKLKLNDSNLKLSGQSNQLNHYFDEAGDTEKLPDAIGGFLSDGDLAAFKEIIDQSKSFALRTRDADGTILLVIKAAKGEGDNQHALERLEGEYETTASDIDTIDKAIQSAGYDFLSKWSRNRIEYSYKGFNVTIDKNAGYGYVAEIEKVVPDSTQAEQARDEILAELKTLEVEELSQERVGRMFEHYNEHWPEYYQTEKTFTVE
ncbi:CYTH domain-containing protein [Patescibacteria group bacterium]|nr:CYTH domain-containing protein [Patescibacteria group bacterium]